MHYLHRILVYIPDICSVGKNYPGATKQQIRSYAKYQTECFDGHAFDWRETMTAGRWGYEYPENVLLAADNPERFQKELQTAQSFQQEAMNQALKYLEDNDYLDLKKLAAAVMEDAQDSPNTQHSLSMAAYYLGCFADLIKGKKPFPMNLRVGLLQSAKCSSIRSCCIVSMFWRLARCCAKRRRSPWI